MLTTIIFAALLADAAPVAAEPADLLKARVDVAIAADLQRECWSPRECAISDELVAAAHEALAAAEALHMAPVKSADPWQQDVYVEPFEDVDAVPDAVEAQAAFELAGLQNTMDELARP